MAELMPVTSSKRQQQGYARRILLAGLGVLFFVLGVVGVFVPVLPTTPFMLLALWAFSLSSQRLHDYVWHHPRCGQAVRDWKSYGIVPRKAKLSAVSVMAVSAIVLVFFSGAPVCAMVAALATMAGAALWLWHRPETVKDP